MTGRARRRPSSPAHQADGLLFGIHPVSSLLQRRPGAVRLLWYQADGRNPRLRGLVDRAAEATIPVRACTAAELDERTGNARHQGVAVRLDLAGLTHREDELGPLLDAAKATALVLVLDGVQDPHNLGACLRAADGAGAHAVIAPRDRAVGLTAAACKVASGAAGRVPFVQVTNLARTLRGLAARGLWIAGADAEGETSLYDLEMTGPLALVLGAEGRGLRRLTRAQCDWLVSIPMAAEAGVESLNVAVAAGIALFEARRQRLAGAR